MKKVTFDKFLLGDPELFSAVVNNRVLMRVTVNNVSIGGGMEEVGEEVGYRYFWKCRYSR